jgi:hypothetical protein
MSLPPVHLVLLLACGSGSGSYGGASALDQTEYLAQYPSVFCAVLQQCEPDSFEASYGGDLQLCVDEITTWGRDRLNRDCGFDGGAAGICVEALEDVVCADWTDGAYQDSCGAIIDC